TRIFPHAARHGVLRLPNAALRWGADSPGRQRSGAAPARLRARCGRVGCASPRTGGIGAVKGATTQSARASERQDDSGVLRARATTRLRRLATAVRSARYLWRSRLHTMRLEPLHEVVVEGDAFRSVGDDPQFLL